MKKVIFIFSTLILFTILKVDVFAKVLTIDEVINELNNGELKQYYQSFNMDLTVTNDTDNKKIIINTSNGILIEANYTDGYIEYKNDKENISAEEFENEITKYVGIGAITNAVLKLSGFENNAINDTYSYDNFETYGLVMKSEKMDFTNVSSSDAKGDFIRLFKISLDTAKIEKLIKDYGTGDNNPEYKDLVANVTVKDVTSTSLYIMPKVVNYNSSDSNSNVPLCQIYKSNTENGQYVLADDFKANCTGGLSLKINDLTPNTTYYFKAKVVGSDKFGDALKITTLNNSYGDAPDNKDDSSDSDKEQEKGNPKTGINDYILSLSFVAALGSVSYIWVNNKNYLKQV